MQLKGWHKAGIAVGANFGLGVASNASWDHYKDHRDEKRKAGTMQKNFKAGHKTVKG